MKYSRKDITKNSIINGWTIVSDIYSEKRNNNYIYYVDAKCKICKEIRKVRVTDLQSGKTTKCSYCGKCYKQFINKYQTIGGYTVLIIKEKETDVQYNFIFDTKFKEEVQKHYWSIIKTNENIYARASDKRSCKNNNLERFHRFICSLEYGEDEIKGMIIDHKNRNTFDTRLENLNIVTSLENSQNAKIRKDNTSGIKGVNWSRKFNKWVARIQYNKKRIGKNFETFEEAVE